MKICIVIAVMGELHRSKPFWSTLLNNVRGPVGLMVVDNAPDIPGEEPIKPFLDRFIVPTWPGAVYYYPQEDNLGVVKSMQFAYEACDHDILAFIHNDLYIHAPGWDVIVANWFESIEDLGLMGFFGAKGIGMGGGRLEVYSHMLEAEIHGYRANRGECIEVAVLDGMAMIASRKMLKSRGGVDCEYDIHHFYDLDLSLESIDRGFKNYALSLPIHHQSGQTACLPVFQEWANRYVDKATQEALGMTGEQIIYQRNRSRFDQKWAQYLPWKVGETWRKKV